MSPSSCTSQQCPLLAKVCWNPSFLTTTWLFIYFSEASSKFNLVTKPLLPYGPRDSSLVSKIKLVSCLHQYDIIIFHDSYMWLKRPKLMTFARVMTGTALLCRLWLAADQNSDIVAEFCTSAHKTWFTVSFQSRKEYFLRIDFLPNFTPRILWDLVSH